ncbi:putative cytosolic regulator pianissimo [Xylona heveae TC161]|uniref:Putative cytosolic regulator pianissimo n=1 Tax=Xylona heveae (strain CBS 132557 / TC161) TaxID=1328760 RepID=A0A165GXV1_XYLHT|nr:putative cytosolic regulator pianissimo [Xylona heveae TC161]KZF22739.1 putative cytosolic regulator pianissimo [Xylona heveae TC161]
MSNYGEMMENDEQRAATRAANDARSMSNVALGLGSRGPSVPPPGSFSSQLRSTAPLKQSNSRPDISVPSAFEDTQTNDLSTTEQRQAEFRDKISKEIKIKIGSENLLEALISKNAKQSREQRLRVESELLSSNRKIAQLKLELDNEIERAKSSSYPAKRLPDIFTSNVARTSPRDIVAVPAEEEEDEEQQDGPETETESPTYVLSETLQALEMEGMQPDYYVERANSLVELFRRHPNLKYDLVWSIFGLRIQTMLLSDSREVVAAGYRLTRYAITDRRSLQTIRALHTDYLVILSLIKEGKASVEREQALKFVRAFLDVEEGVAEISIAVARTIVSVAEHVDDRLRSICLLTLAEILIQDSSLLVAAGGIGPLTESLADGTYQASETLVAAFLYLLDTPSKRLIFRSGSELETVFSPFTDPLVVDGNEEKLKSTAKVIASMLKTWPGLITLSMHNFTSIKSLVSAIYFPMPKLRGVIYELLFDILRIKPPSWSSPFLAGRRLTTYGRVTNLNAENQSSSSSVHKENEYERRSLVDHFISLLLAVFLEAGLLEALLHVLEDTSDPVLRRKTTLLLGEILKLANNVLPSKWSGKIQTLPGLFSLSSKFDARNRFVATNAVYQVDSVNRTLYRSGPANGLSNLYADVLEDDSQLASRQVEQGKSKLGVQMDEAQFRTLLLETQVLNTVNFTKWRWDLIQNIIDGPLLNPKRLDEAMKATKFVKRVLGFYRPFKYRFANVRNTKPNQRYVKAGCSLVQTLLQHADGVKFLADNKLLRQIAECLAQLDRMSGLTSLSPLFSRDRLSETLTGGYFAILGALGSDTKGLQIMEKLKIFNMFYHIIELKDRNDLIKTLLGNMNFSLDSHLRVLLSKAMTSCPKDIRLFATKLLRKYAIGDLPATNLSVVTENAEWSIRLLVTQLYDPDVEVCEVAIKILEEACNRKYCLEYVVKCRPALDHLGEIGAPLLLRFLSTSVGYHYLDGLDYISQEMDDWFLGRNDSYVTLVEASLAHAFRETPERHRQSLDIAIPQPQDHGIVPPHFYRELTRTAEGCKLLRRKGHFNDFVSTIRSHGLEKDDTEIILKVKGCLWAVGNVGSMELGAPFLEETDAVQCVLRIAEQSEVMSLRGTAFFVVGLISRSLHGMEILSEHGWDSATTFMGESLGFCLPLDLNRLFSIRPWNPPCPDVNSISTGPNGSLVAFDEDPIHARVLRLVVDLGNTVLTTRAASDLHTVKMKRPDTFRKPKLFHQIMNILQMHHIRLPVRRFVIDLFDKRVMRQIVLDEEDEDDSEEKEEEEEEEVKKENQGDEEGTPVIRAGSSSGPIESGANAVPVQQ